jgi:hypothetical protein
MRTSVSLFVTGTLAVLTVGCSSSETGSPSSAGSGLSSAAAVQVVQEFLEAVRQGNTDSASSRLTPLALKRTSELDLNFSPPGSPTARFTVGQAELVEADKAVVESTWTDLDADGKPQNEQIIWALKLTGGQWRISGMAAELGADQPPLVMDFENPEQLAPLASPPGNVTATPRQAALPREDPFRTY